MKAGLEIGGEDAVKVAGEAGAKAGKKFGLKVCFQNLEYLKNVCF